MVEAREDLRVRYRNYLGPTDGSSPPPPPGAGVAISSFALSDRYPPGRAAFGTIAERLRALPAARSREGRPEAVYHRTAGKLLVNAVRRGAFESRSAPVWEEWRSAVQTSLRDDGTGEGPTFGEFFFAAVYLLCRDRDRLDVAGAPAFPDGPPTWLIDEGCRLLADLIDAEGRGDQAAREPTAPAAAAAAAPPKWVMWDDIAAAIQAHLEAAGGAEGDGDLPPAMAARFRWLAVRNGAAAPLPRPRLETADGNLRLWDWDEVRAWLRDSAGLDVPPGLPEALRQSLGAPPTIEPPDVLLHGWPADHDDNDGARADDQDDADLAASDHEGLAPRLSVTRAPANASPPC